MMQRYRLLARAVQRGAREYGLPPSSSPQIAPGFLRSPSNLQLWRALWSLVRDGMSESRNCFAICSDALRGGGLRQQVRHAKVNGSEVQSCYLILFYLYVFEREDEEAP